jgi:Tol biopolymer transport system component
MAPRPEIIPQIAFRQNRDAPNNFEIYVINADGTGLANLTNHPARDECPYWSPDGRSIAFESDRDGGGLYLMAGDGSNQRLLTAEFTRCEIPDATMAWSPDGEWFSFVSCPDGPPDIYVIKPDGSGLTNLTHNPATDDNFRWSPDGQHMAFGSDRDGNKEIYLLDVQAALQGKADANPIRLTDNPAVDIPTGWSPDCTRLLFLSERDGNPDAYVMAADGSGQTRLTTDPALDFFPAWSPAGQWIAFVSTRDGNLEVYVMAPDGAGQRNLTNSPATDAQFWWSPDGAQVAVSSMQAEAWSTWIVGVEGVGRKQLDIVGCLDWRPPFGP